MTTIHLPDDLRDRLAAHKLHPRETYADVVARALDIVDEDDLELSPEFQRKVEQARAQAAAGQGLTTQELARELGV